jgi:hypothetical protein
MRGRGAQLRACSRARRPAPHVAGRPENVHKRYLVHVAGHNLGLLMRALFEAGIPKEAAVIRTAFLFVIQTAEAITVVIVTVFDADVAALIIAVASDVACPNRDFFTGLLTVKIHPSQTADVTVARRARVRGLREWALSASSHVSSLWTLQHLCFGPDVAADCSCRG